MSKPKEKFTRDDKNQKTADNNANMIAAKFKHKLMTLTFLLPNSYYVDFSVTPEALTEKQLRIVHNFNKLQRIHDIYNRIVTVKSQ